MIQCINRVKDKKQRTISKDAKQKSFDEIQHPFMIKALKKLGLERSYLNLVKAVYDKPTANIILNGKELKVLPLTSGMRQRCLPSPLLFNIVLEILPTA
jgi:hypothetical protein